jgi:hypothetical protein
MEIAPPMTGTVDPADSGGPSAAARHCDHCGRVVRETLHSRTSYVVDCFVRHTGATEIAIVRRPASDETVLVYQRLVRPAVVITCTDCYDDPRCRRRHQSWAYPAD